jgi:hypothetical protein
LGWDLKMTYRRYALLSCSSLYALASIAFPSSGAAADLPSFKEPPAPIFTKLPAVDGINGKAEFFGGATDFYNYDVNNFRDFPPYAVRNNWRGGGGGIGTVSVPLGTDFGLQVDTIVASWNNRIATGGAGHLFWRNPTRGLIGVYGSGLYWGGAGGIGIGRAAGEGELYFGNFTAKALIGAEFGQHSQVGSAAFGLAPLGAPYLAYDWYDVRTRFFDKISLSYYVFDNLELSVGHLYTGGRNAATLSAEYLLPASFGSGVSASAFVEGRVGERNANAVMGGVRFYFGNSEKSLIRRHREDDPGTHLKDDLFTLSNSHKSSAIPIIVPTTQTPPPDGSGPITVN